MEVYVSLDNVSYHEKPSGKEIGKVKYRIAQNWKKIDVLELAGLVGGSGHAMIPAKMEGGISEKHCSAMQLFALDFDHDCCFERIKEKCTQMGFHISFAYHTYSSTQKEERFRIVFTFEYLLEDSYVIKIVMAILHQMFPECDQQCKNLDRLFWGGKKLIYVDGEARLTLVQLFSNFYVELERHNHFKRNIQSFCKKYRISLYNHLPLIGFTDTLSSFGDILDSTIIHIIGKTTKSPFFIAEKKGLLHQSSTCRKKLQRLDLSETGGCRLLNDFKEGYELDHAAKFALITNLMYINGGQKLFLDTLYEYDQDSHEKWKRNMPYLKAYKPQRCQETFCPYYPNCENAGTIVDTLALDRKIFIEPISYVSLEEATKCLNDNLEKAYRSPYQGIHLISAQTAIGKTTAYIELIRKYSDIKFIVALPTNILKEEVADRLNTVIPNDVYMTASIHGNIFIPKEIREKISRYHEVGIHNKTKGILKEYYTEIENDPNKPAVAKECKKVIEGLNGIKDERVIVTTHAFLMQFPEEFLRKYTIIIDEDILQLQFFNCCHSATLEGIKQLLQQDIPQYTKLARQILYAEENTYYKIDDIPYKVPITNEQWEEMECGRNDNLGDLVYARSFVKSVDKSSGESIVYYFCPPMLPAMKYIVLSATLNPDIYAQYFKNVMQVYNYPQKKAKYEGKLEQYTYHSLGRRDLASKLQIFGFACELAQNSDLGFITFMKFEGKVSVAGRNILPLHFGNSTGVNNLAGKDLGIVGTPFKNDQAYKLIACYLGADINNECDVKPRPRRVQYKGKSFIITTYSDSLLRELQLYSIESELEQCVGRARLLRKSCTVYLFSAFPCEQAELHIKDYL